MKIIVLHGDHTEKSYDRLQKFIGEAKKRSWEVRKIFASKVNSVAEELAGVSLFNQQQFYVLEEPTKIKKVDIEWINKRANSINATLIIYHRGTLSKTFIKQISTDKIEEYKLPKKIWTFLDSFYPGNSKNCLAVLHEVVETEPVEFIFSLLAKLLRDLYWVKVNAETISYPAWRVGKLKRQASKFTKKLLKRLLAEFSRADIKAKTSKGKLIDSLDFIVITKLE